MKSSLRHDDSVDSMTELNSFDSSKGDDQESMYAQGDCPPLNHQNVNGGNSTRLLSQEGVYQLTKDVRIFSEALTSLKSVFLDDRSCYTGSLRVKAHESLGDLLQVLRVVVDKYPEINSTDVLTVASDLINHVKGYNYEQDGTDLTQTEIFRAINNLAMIFSNSVSECLMGDDGSFPMLAASSPLFDTAPPSNSSVIEYDEITRSLSEVVDSTTQEDTEELLLKLETGLEMTFDRAKILSKYLGELISYVKKKASLVLKGNEIKKNKVISSSLLGKALKKQNFTPEVTMACEFEHSRNMLKLSQQTKQILSDQSFLPFQSLYCTNLDHEQEHASNCQRVHQNLSMKYIESLQAKKVDHDKKRKQIRESWTREKKRSEEAITSMKKAKQNYFAKMQEFQKAHEAALKAEGEQLQMSQQVPKLSSSSSSSTLGAFYSSSSAGKVDKKKKLVEDMNIKALNAEQTYKTAISEANRRVKALDQNKALCLQQLRDLILQCDQTTKNVTLHFFQLHYQLFAPLPVQFQAMLEDAKRYEPGYQFAQYVSSLPQLYSRRSSSFQFEAYPTDNAPVYVVPASGFSDTESSSSRSLDDLSPSGDLARNHAHRRHSTEDSLSSDDILDEIPAREGRTSGSATLTPNDFSLDSPVPLRTFTKNAIRVAANVKGAFTGKKASKSTLFGVDFLSVAQNSPDGIPFLVKKCVSEIDNRALPNKGIYRMNGVKNRVERICTQFDLLPEKIDLSQHSAHDVTGALKHFLRQLSEPLLLFRYYDVFLNIAKDYAQLVKASSNEAVNSEKEDPSFEQAEPYLKRLRDAVDRLPVENRNTLQYIISHLSRVADHSRENKMTASNLAIVFGPTLLRKSTSNGNESLESLMDLPHQSCVVEILILHKDFIFGVHTIKPEANAGVLRLESTESSSLKSVEVNEKSSNEFELGETPSSSDEKYLHTADDMDLGPVFSNSVGLDESEVIESVSNAPPSSPHDDNEFQPLRHIRKTPIRSSSPPPLSAFDFNAPPLPARRRKKSRRPPEDTESADNFEHRAETSQHSPRKDYFASSTFHAGIEKLGNIARRFSRDNAISNLTATGRREDDKHGDFRSSRYTRRKSSVRSAPPGASSSKDDGYSSRKLSSVLPATSASHSIEEGGCDSRKSSLLHDQPPSSTILLLDDPSSSLQDGSFC